jgi:hypothetical protein
MRSITVNDTELSDLVAPLAVADWRMDVGWLVPVLLNTQPPAELAEALKVTSGSFDLTVESPVVTSEAAAQSAFFDRVLALPRHGTLRWTDATGQSWLVPECELTTFPHVLPIGIVWRVSVAWSGRGLVKVTSNFWELLNTNWEDLNNNWETYV